MERILVQRGINLKSDLLLAPHHGSKGSGSNEFIEEVDPEIIVISAGQNSQKTYLDANHLSTWRNQDRKVILTSDSGTITCLSDGKNIKTKTFAVKPQSDQ